jgi:hypothetical protein
MVLIDLLVGTIEQHPFPGSPHVQLLRRLLEKLRPQPQPSDDEDGEADGTPELDCIP